MNLDKFELIYEAMKLFEARDLDGLMTYFADDAFMFNGDYPTNAMYGKETIRENLALVFKVKHHISFEVHNIWGNEQAGAFEIIARVSFDNQKMQFTQIHVFESQDNLFTLWRVYPKLPMQALGENN